MKYTVLGGGSWGTALSIQLSRNNNEVKIWEFFEEQANEMQETRICPFLPDVNIPDSIEITSDLGNSIKNSEAILIVVPSDKVEATLENAKKFMDNQPVIICSKGFGGDQTLLSEAVSKILPENDVYCLYGPTLAKEVALGQLSAIVLAGPDSHKTAIQKSFQTANFRVETSEDIVGVQIGAALKNVVTIFVGIMDGMGEGQNGRAYVFVKGLNEIKEIGVALGAKADTFLGLTAVGDLTLESRNRKLGVEIGKGRKLDEILASTDHVSEGVVAIKNAMILKERLNLQLPVIETLNSILFEEMDPKEALKTI